MRLAMFNKGQRAAGCQALNAGSADSLAISDVRDREMQPTLDRIVRRYGGRLRQRLGWMAAHGRQACEVDAGGVEKRC